MKRIFAAVLLALACAANAGQTYVATTGSDSNDCLSAGSPCLTLQAAADKLKSADGMTGSGQVAIADGTYSAGATVLYYRHVEFLGNCSSPWNVVISTASGATAFSGQDHAILIVKCMEISTPNGIGIALRQFTIGDYLNIRWTAAAIHVSADEMSKVNCGESEWVLNGATYHVALDRMSQAILGCSTWINSGQTFTAYLNIDGGSGAFLVGSGFTGPGTGTNTTGRQGITGSNGSLIRKGSITVPGSTGYDASAGGQVQ